MAYTLRPTYGLTNQRIQIAKLIFFPTLCLSYQFNYHTLFNLLNPRKNKNSNFIPISTCLIYIFNSLKVRYLNFLESEISEINKLMLERQVGLKTKRKADKDSVLSAIYDFVASLNRSSISALKAMPAWRMQARL